MDINGLKKKRGFSIEQGFTEDFRIQYKTSDINKAREAYSIFESLGASMSFGGVNGGKAVGGYYAN